MQLHRDLGHYLSDHDSMVSDRLLVVHPKSRRLLYYEPFTTGPTKNNRARSLSARVTHPWGLSIGGDHHSKQAKNDVLSQWDYNRYHLWQQVRLYCHHHANHNRKDNAVQENVSEYCPFLASLVGCYTGHHE